MQKFFNSVKNFPLNVAQMNLSSLACCSKGCVNCQGKSKARDSYCGTTENFMCHSSK